MGLKDFYFENLGIKFLGLSSFFKISILDGAFFCYCAYVLRISGWSENILDSRALPFCA